MFHFRVYSRMVIQSFAVSLCPRVRGVPVHQLCPRVHQPTSEPNRLLRLGCSAGQTGPRSREEEAASYLVPWWDGPDPRSFSPTHKVTSSQTQVKSSVHFLDLICLVIWVCLTGQRNFFSFNPHVTRKSSLLQAYSGCPKKLYSVIHFEWFCSFQP